MKRKKGRILFFSLPLLLRCLEVYRFRLSFLTDELLFLCFFTCRVTELLFLPEKTPPIYRAKNAFLCRKPATKTKKRQFVYRMFTKEGGISNFAFNWVRLVGADTARRVPTVMFPVSSVILHFAFCILHLIVWVGGRPMAAPTVLSQIDFYEYFPVSSVILHFAFCILHLKVGVPTVII